MAQDLRAGMVRDLAAKVGFEIAGVTGAGPLVDFPRYQSWAERGLAGKMSYLTDRRGGLRQDSRVLLPTARSVICVGKLYNAPAPYSTAFTDSERGWISRYAWGEDYHGVLREGLEKLAALLEGVAGPFDRKVCVDTAPLLERSLAREAGLGWIGKNTCLINQERGSWFFLGELLTSLPFAAEQEDAVYDRCGTCSRCIDACPTAAIRPHAESGYEIDSRRCIAYLTIELRGSIETSIRDPLGQHVFGCDICQDVCPWNRSAAVTADAAFQPQLVAPPLERLAALTETEFRALFGGTPIERSRYTGFLRNVAVAMGNSGSGKMIEPLCRLAQSNDPVVAEHAAWALRKLNSQQNEPIPSELSCFAPSFPS